MTSVNNNKQNPLDALQRLFGTTTKEVGRAAGEFATNTTKDIDSISTAIETGGFIGGVLQFYDKFSAGNVAGNLLDSATGPGALPPQIKEGVSAAVNYAAGNPIFLKDLFDLLTAPSKPGVPPSKENAVPPPNVDQLTGGGPKAPGPDGRTGFSESPAAPRSRQEIAIVINDTTMPLSTYMEALKELRNDPTLKDKAPALYDVLHDPKATLQDINFVVVADAFQKNPKVFEQLKDLKLDDRIVVDQKEIGSVETPKAPEQTAPTAPPAGTGQGDFSNFLNQAMGIFGQLAGPLGMGMQLLGGLLSNPLVANFIAPLLVQGLNFIAPGLGVALAPILPVALPAVGMALQGIGGSLAGSAPAGQGGAPGGLGLDMFGDILGSLAGGLGGGAGALPAVA